MVRVFDRRNGERPSALAAVPSFQAPTSAAGGLTPQQLERIRTNKAAAEARRAAAGGGSGGFGAPVGPPQQPRTWLDDEEEFNGTDWQQDQMRPSLSDALVAGGFRTPTLITGLELSSRLRTTRQGLQCFPVGTFYGQLWSVDFGLLSLFTGSQMTQLCEEIDACAIMTGQTGGVRSGARFSRVLANTSTRGGRGGAPTVGHERLLAFAAANPASQLAFLLSVESVLNGTCAPLATGNCGISHMPEQQRGTRHKDKPDEPGLVRVNHVRLSRPGQGRAHTLEFTQCDTLMDTVLQDGERVALDVLKGFYAFAPCANGEAEFAPRRTAHHQRIASAESLARLQDYRWETFDPQKLLSVLCQFAMERARTHGLTQAGSHEPFTIPVWRSAEGEGPDGAVDCFQKGACKEVQGKKARSSFMSRMTLGSRIGDAATRQGLADGASSDDEFSALPVVAAPSPPLAAIGSVVPDASGSASAVTPLIPRPIIENSVVAMWADENPPPTEHFTAEWQSSRQSQQTWKQHFSVGKDAQPHCLRCLALHDPRPDSPFCSEDCA